MAAKATSLMRTTGYLGPALSVDVYTLARYIASEVGSGTPSEKVAVGEAAINRARRWGLSIRGLLLDRAPSPNKGYYGPIHCKNADGSLGAPYGRWAATSRDPAVDDVLIAQMVFSGESGNFSKGADDQANVVSYNDPAGKVRALGAKNSYWVGPLPGVDHRHTFLFAYRPEIAPNSPIGLALIQAGVQATTAPSPNWTGLETCKATSKLPAVVALGLTGVAGYLLYRQRDRWIKRLIP